MVRISFFWVKLIFIHQVGILTKVYKVIISNNVLYHPPHLFLCVWNNTSLFITAQLISSFVTSLFNTYLLNKSLLCIMTFIIINRYCDVLSC